MSVNGIAGAQTARQWTTAQINIPHDPGTIIVYVLLMVAAFVLWYGNRQSKKASGRRSGDKPEDGATTPPSSPADAGEGESQPGDGIG